MAKKKVFSIGTALAQGLEDTIASAQNYTGELCVEIIPLKRIDTDPDNPRDLAISPLDVQDGISSDDPDRQRKLQELDSLQSIANSIKSQGIINPITVYKYGERYRLIAGERRTLASILADKTDIPAKILDSKPDALKVSLLQWIENMERSDLSLWERLKNLEKIVEMQATSKGVAMRQITVTEISQLIGCAKSHAVNYRAVLHADDELKQLIFSNQIRNLEKAALLAGIDSPGIKQQAVTACINGATLKQLKLLADERPNLVLGRQREIERRGKKTTKINLGVTTQPHVARLVLDAVLKHPSLSCVTTQFDDIDWNDSRSVTELFKRLVKTLEKLPA